MNQSYAALKLANFAENISEMKIKAGDTVRYLNDVGGGIVVRAIDNSTVLVRNEDDFEVPVLISELIVVDAGDKDISVRDSGTIPVSITQSVTIEEEEESDELVYFNSEQSIEKIETADLEVLFALVPKKPESPIDSDLNTYLINNSAYTILYSYSIVRSEITIGREFGTLEPDTKIYLESYSKSDIITISSFVLQIIPAFIGEFELVQPWEKHLSIKGGRLFKPGVFKENDYFEEPAMILDLTKDSRNKSLDIKELNPDEIKSAIVEKEVISVMENTPRQFKSGKVAPVTVEVDLHIHNLVDYDYRRLSNGDMLNIQLEHFHRKINEAIARKINRVVFIHGVGNGTLKLEIRKALDTQYRHVKYQDASFAEYGYGATLVIVK